MPELPSPQALAAVREGTLSQKAMAAAIGVDAGQLSRWERGRGEMSYDKIRRYAAVLRLRAAAADPVRLLVERIAGRVALRELRPMDPLERAVELMATHHHEALPVLTARGDEYAGVLTDAMVCHALGVGDLAQALTMPIGALSLEPLLRVTPEDDLSSLTAKLASHPVVLVIDHDGLPAGFAFRRDVYPLMLGDATRRR